MPTPNPPPPTNSTTTTTSYTQGHHPSVTRSHASRTATNSAAFLLPHLLPHHHILDVGCGPGTITAGFCAHVPLGHVTGIDASASVITEAQSQFPSSSSKCSNLTFQTADIMSSGPGGGLPFPDGSFDVVFTHQVLLHLPDRVAAVREMRRVCRPNGGLLASREADGASFTWYPDPTGTLTLWRDAMVRMINSTTTTSSAGEGEISRGGSGRATAITTTTSSGGLTAQGPATGVALHTWFRLAGLDPSLMVKSTSTTSYSTPAERAWWAGLHKERIEASDVREKFLDVGGVSEEELSVMGQAMLDWADDVDGVFALMQFEVVCPV